MVKTVKTVTKNPNPDYVPPIGRIQKTKEADEQEMLFRWAAWAENQSPEIRLMFHVPNGGKRNEKEAAHLKRLGVKPGVPDIFLPAARGNYHGLFIELKAAGGRASDKQKDWLEGLRAQGYKAEICVGWTEAAALICGYLGIAPPDMIR